MFNLNKISFLFKIQLIGILILTSSILNAHAQSNQSWDEDVIQDYVLFLKIDSLVNKDLWRIDQFETEKEFEENSFSRRLFKEFYMQEIAYKNSEVIKYDNGQNIYSYSTLAIVIAPKNRRVLLQTVLFCFRVKFDLIKGKKNCLIITREPNEKSKNTNFSKDSIILRDLLLSQISSSMRK